MHHKPGPRRRVSARIRVLAPLAVVTTAVLAAVPAAGFADSATTPPQYTAAQTGKLNGGLLSDIAGSAFVDKDGQFHWSNGDTPYDTNPAHAWANTFTNTDLGAVSSGMGTTTTKKTAAAYYADPGTICYQLDKDGTHPVPSPQQDDHCDVIGVRVDQAGTWHALLNDEFQFDPWSTSGPTATVAQKIATANHNNRILLATSTDKGASWQYAGPALTSAWDDDQVIDGAASPGTSYPFGNSGCRLYVDYSSGYFYITYNVKIYKKPASSTLASWTEMARAPISGGMASGTWQKWYDGAWSQPGIGGIDGNVNSIGGLNVAYDPTTDAISWNGTGANSAVSYQGAQVQSDHIAVFSDDSGNSYTVNTLAHTMVNNATGQAVPGRTVKYTDPTTGMNMWIRVLDDVYVNGVKTVTGGLYVTQTDPKTGASQTVDLITGSGYFKNAQGHIYLPAVNNESAISYNAYAGMYRIVGYDGNVYETADLGDPNSWKVVGTMPTGSNGGYLTSLDDGSLTNQNVTGRSFLTISDLNGTVVDIDQTAAADGSVASKEYVPSDTDGNAVTADGSYILRVGGKAVNANGGPSLVGGNGAATSSSSWQLVPVADPNSTGQNSGFFRLVNPATGKDLQIAGDGIAAQRAMGAVAKVGDQQPNGTAMSSTSLGSTGGSDQWYLQRVATHGTSVAGSTTYRLVNRNSGLALQFAAGRMRLAQQAPGDAGQYVTLAAR
ncbi:RICIN domain-containing protein [Planctomonas sp. JC2975]|uniref:RICIN domain-containing protein n=1 Tax=Planctomonas sp. JC2975 TaxID=2729626 RepID=UPI0014741FFF|nr:RICIN domain-containing protein [Planctomonas sp. JC2975]NNC12427.1 RICIN domain-containing protein [Planctomonas sp. JC2975]